MSSFKALVTDIEGTTTSISFVKVTTKGHFLAQLTQISTLSLQSYQLPSNTTNNLRFQDVLFPYAYDNVGNFLEANHQKDEIKKVIHNLVELSKEDAHKDGDVKVPDDDEGSKKCREDLVHNVHVWINKDKKVDGLG